MKYRQIISIEKKFSKYIFAKETDFTKKMTKSKSPSSATAAESPDSINANDHKTLFNLNKSSLINDDNNPFIFESKNCINHNPFLSNLNSNNLFQIKSKNDEEENNNNPLLDTKVKINSYLKIKNETQTQLFESNKEDLLTALSTENIFSNCFVNEENKDKNNNSLLEKEKIIIEALSIFDNENLKNNNNLEINNEFSNSNDKNSFEYKIYCEINNHILKYYDYFNSKDNSLENDNDEKFNNFMEEIFVYEEKKGKICISYKIMVLSLINLINKFIIENYLETKRDLNDTNIFIELCQKYNKIKDISSHIEKNLKLLIYNFQKKNKKICICGLLTDIYWDSIFRIHLINNNFTKNYTNKNLNVDTKKSMKSIIDMLIVHDIPYQTLIGDILDISSIKNEKNHLMNFIIKLKKSANPFSMSNNLFENKEIEDTENYSLEEVYKYIQGDTEHKKKHKKHRKKKKKVIEKTEEPEQEINKSDPIVEEFVKYLNDFNEVNKVKIIPVISKEWIESLTLK